MTKKTGFIHRKHKREHWKKIAAEWSACLESYRIAEDDSALWYTEMTNTALLSAAAWKAGIPSTCELQTLRNKGREISTGQKKSSNGRIDLYLSVGDRGEYVEAKQANINISKFDLSAIERDDNSLLARARDNAATLQHSAGGWRTGLVVCSLYQAPVDRENPDPKIEAIIQSAGGKNARSSFYFWHFFASSERPKASDGGISLGGIVLGRATARAFEKV